MSWIRATTGTLFIGPGRQADYLPFSFSLSVCIGPGFQAYLKAVTAVKIIVFKKIFHGLTFQILKQIDNKI